MDPSQKIIKTDENTVSGELFSEARILFIIYLHG